MRVFNFINNIIFNTFMFFMDLYNLKIETYLFNFANKQDLQRLLPNKLKNPKRRIRQSFKLDKLKTIHPD